MEYGEYAEVSEAALTWFVRNTYKVLVGEGFAVRVLGVMRQPGIHVRTQQMHQYLSAQKQTWFNTTFTITLLLLLLSIKTVNYLQLFIQWRPCTSRLCSHLLGLASPCWQRWHTVIAPCTRTEHSGPRSIHVTEQTVISSKNINISHEQFKLGLKN